MDRAYMSVAKRTRSGVTKNLVQLAAEIPRTAKDPASPVEINVISDDDDEVLSNNNKCAASNSRKCVKSVGSAKCG